MEKISRRQRGKKIPMLAPAEANALERLEKLMGEGFREIKEKIEGLDARLRTIEQTEGSCKAVQELKLGTLEREQNDLKRRVVELEAVIEKVMPWVSGAKWLTGALGLSIIALIWGILTHTITLAFH